RISRAGREEEAVLLVDLREVRGRRRLTLLQRAEALRGRGLADMHAAVLKAGDGRGAGRRHRVLRPQALLLEEAGGDRRDQRRVERGEAGELDADVVAHEDLPSATATPEGAHSCGSPETVVRCIRRRWRCVSYGVARWSTQRLSQTIRSPVCHSWR